MANFGERTAAVVRFLLDPPAEPVIIVAGHQTLAVRRRNRREPVPRVVLQYVMIGPIARLGHFDHVARQVVPSVRGRAGDRGKLVRRVMRAALVEVSRAVAVGVLLESRPVARRRKRDRRASSARCADSPFHRQIVNEHLLFSAGSSAKSSCYRISIVLAITLMRGCGSLAHRLQQVVAPAHLSRLLFEGGMLLSPCSQSSSTSLLWRGVILRPIAYLSFR